MKRGKDDEKMMGPLFPRLHVNDTEKGGPRAPPRNKMALYEQLSIPSQRFSPAVVPLKSGSTGNLVPSGSSNQRGSLERNLQFQQNVPPSMSSQLAEQFHSREPDGRSLNVSIRQHEKRKKGGDEEDFRVPIFVQSGTAQYHTDTQNDVDREKLTPFSTIHSGGSKIQNDVNNVPRVVNSTCSSSRRHVVNQNENIGVCMSNTDHSVRYPANTSTAGKIARTERVVNASSNQQSDSHSAADSSRLRENESCLRQEPIAGLQTNDDCYGDSNPGLIKERDKGNAIIMLQRSNSCSRQIHCRTDGPEIDSECHGDKTAGSVQLGNGDKSNDCSEISMLDGVSALAISPDDVVGIIGQKHFWKARRAIANQQRVFAVQVFELHRLIKVQQLIAGSPHLLLEDSTFLGKPSAEGPPPEKLPSEYVVNTPAQVAKRKDDSEKSNHKMECSAENAVGRTSLSSAKNGTQPSNCVPYAGNMTSAPMPPDPKMTPWYLPVSYGHQWLLPVMTPSEGLVYKPYAAPGYMGSACGGCGPFSSTPVNCNSMNPMYGNPTTYHHHHHQGIGVLPGTYGYYPSYGMPMMNPTMSGSAVEQMNSFVGSGSHGQTGQLPGGGANVSMQNQSSCNVPSQRNENIHQARKFQASKDTELQGSSDESVGPGMAQDGADGRDALPLFPMVQAAPEGDPHLEETDQPRRVIRVVPRNRGLATESAARIFQSIQEERKQLDST